MKHLFYKDLNAALLFLVATVSIDGVADNDHYRWQDSNGQTVYSDQPPPNSEKYDIISTPTNPNTLTSDVGDEVPQATVSSESKEGDTENNAELCRSAKANFRVLEGPGKVSVRDEQGAVRELTPQERTTALQTAKAKIDVYCK